VTVSNDRVEIIAIGGTVANGDEAPDRRTIVVRAKLPHRNRARVLDDGLGGPTPVLMRALGRAHEWRGWMERGEAMSYRAIAKKAGVNPGYVQTILPLAFLAPALTRDLLNGRRQLHGPLMVRMREGVPASWSQQADRL
jgi:site-specific DNA recombinase